ncbi:Ig-like domain-containing protein [Carnobacterium divergens]|uniref:Ig-like domain-containing protein n=1 Tax=Carnobacterium divergens TaxID=2748 RepID=UPI0039C9D7E9
MKKNKLMQIFLLVMLLLNTVLPSLATTVSAAGITKNGQAKAGTGTISAVFFEDLNMNDQQDPSEPGVAGIEVTLFDATVNKKLGTATTDSSGRYTFSNLPAGRYYLKIGEVPQGYRWFGQGPLGFGGGSTRYFDLAEGQTESGAYMTLYPTTASMKGIAYSDKNKNGQKDSDEVGIAGLETAIFKVGSSTPVQTTTTDGQGAYHFSKLEPNTPYSVEIKFPSDYEVTSKSYFIGSGKSEAISLSEEQMLENVNLGLYKAVPVGSISVNPTVLEKFVGESGTLVATVLPVDATDKSVTYSSGDTTVMTVDSNGNWVAKKAGTTTIKVTSNEDKSKFAYVTVTVKEKYNPTISGQIQNETGSGFSGISIELREPGSDRVIQQTTSSIDGSYSFTGLTNNVNYYIKVMIPKDYKVKFGYGIFDTAGTSGYLKLEESNKSNITGINLQLEPKTILPESIKVSPKVIDTVVNETGQLTVEFFPTNTTNKDLTYKVGNVDIISVDANGKWTAKKSGKTTITVISASGAQDIVEVTVRSLTDSYIGGKIVDPNGKAVNGVELLIYSWDGKLVGQKTTDGTGAYRFDNLEAKHYYLQLKFPKEYEFVSSNKNYFWGNSTGYLHVDGTNSIGDVDAVIRLANPKESSLSGTIYDQTNNGIGFSGVEIQLVNADTGQITKTLTNTNGTYSFSNLEKSNYYLKIIAPVNYEFASSNVFYYDLLTGYIAVDGVAKQDGFDASLKVITPKNNSSIKGIITNQETGLGFPGVQLNLYSQDGSQKGTAVTATDGSYNFIGLTPGDYYVKLVFPVDYQLSHSNIFGSDGTSGYLALDGTNQLTDRNATLKKTTIEAESITVEPKELNQLVGDTGKLTVTFQPNNTTDKNVNFTSKNPNVITVDKDGNWIATGQGTTEIVVTTSNGKSETVNVTVKSKQESSISGKITNHSTGLGFEGISMKLYTFDGKLVSEVSTDVNGNYSFIGLSKNDYYMIVGVPEGQILFTSNTFGSDGVSGFYGIDGSNKIADRNATLKPKDIPAVGITVEPKELNQFVGDTGKLAITFQPGSTTDKSLNFVSEKPEIMTIDKDGNWTATGVGTTTITVTTSNGKTATVKVTVKSKQESSISGVITNHSTGLGLSEVTLKLYTLDGKLINEVITDMNGQYSFGELSKNDYYLVLSVPEGLEIFYSNTFGSDGVSGFYTIDGSNKIADRNATLKPKDIPAIGITVEPKELNQVVGDTGKLAITFQPGNTTDKSLNFVSEKPEIMTIDKDGNWTATGVGTTTITVTTSNGKTATVKVTVKSKQESSISGVIISHSTGLGLSEITLKLYTPDGKLVNEVITDMNGQYSFGELSKNDYYLVLSVPEGQEIFHSNTFGSDGVSGVYGIDGSNKLTDRNATLKSKDIPAIGITVEPKELNQVVGDTGKLAITFQPGSTTDKSLNFVSADSTVLTIDKDGNWTATGVGTTTITVTTSNGKTATVAVTVRAKQESSISGVITRQSTGAGISGVTLTLYTADSKPYGEVTTNAKGEYTFSNLPKNNYYIVLTVPTGQEIAQSDTFGSDGVSGFYTIDGSNKLVEKNASLKTKDILAESITVEPKELNQVVGDTGKLTITFQPSNTADKSLNFVSADSTVLTIDKDGNWTATGVGTTTITVTTSNGKTATVAVTVRAKQESSISGVITRQSTGAGISGVTLTLYTADSKPYGEVTTNAKGEYTFSNLPKNNYYIVLTVPTGQEIAQSDTFGSDGVSGFYIIDGSNKLVEKNASLKTKDILAESITVEPKELNQVVGDTGKLTITFQPGNTTDKSLNFVSADSTVLTIDKDGNWTATGVGTTTITVTTSNGKTATVKVTVTAKEIPAESITVEPKELNQVVGDTGKLAITFQPENTTDKSLNFVSADSKVMTIDKDGNWTATGVGTTTITVTTSNGKTATVKATVTAKEIPAESITVEPKALNQVVGDTGKLAITFQPSNTTDKSLNFVSNDPSILTIDNNGNWIAMKEGTTVITVTTSNGKTAFVFVTVKAKDIPVESITVEPKELNQLVGDTGKLAITFQPSNATDKSLNFVSNDPSILTIDSNGNWTAMKEGTTVITVTTSNGKTAFVFVTVKAKDIPVESITVEPKELNQLVGDTGKLAITFQPSNATDKSLNFVSNDPSILTIDSNGNWTAVKEGTTVITVTTSNGKTAFVFVTVKAKDIPAESITVEPKELNQFVGDTGKLAITFQPGNTTDKSLNFESRNPDILTIDSNGNWTAVKEGTTVITVTTSNGKTAFVFVTVKAKDIPAESITVEPKELNQFVGDTGKLAITFQPGNTTDKSLNFESRNPDILTIDSNGNWTAVKEGTTVITVTTSNGKTAFVFVTVKANGIPVESITVEPKELNQLVGDTGKLAITFQPSNATDKSLNFVSNDPSIMTIDSNGNWTAMKEGSTVITVTTSNGKLVTVLVTVKEVVKNGVHVLYEDYPVTTGYFDPKGNGYENTGFDHDFGALEPYRGLGPDHYRITKVGYIQIKEDGQYGFLIELKGNDAGYVGINDKQIINYDPKIGGNKDNPYQFFKKGDVIKVEIKHFHRDPSASAPFKLKWTTPSNPYSPKSIDVSEIMQTPN